jgi:hypothetical protein
MYVYKSWTTCRIVPNYTMIRALAHQADPSLQASSPNQDKPNIKTTNQDKPSIETTYQDMPNIDLTVVYLPN